MRFVYCVGGKLESVCEAAAVAAEFLAGFLRGFVVQCRRLSTRSIVWLMATGLLGCAPPNAYQPPPPPKVTVALPVRQTVTNFLEETGTTEPVGMVSIRARVVGFLEQIKFEAGAEVQAGDTLYVIQDREFRAKVNAAKADVEAQEAALNLAEIEYARQQKMVSEQATPQSRVDQARAARDAAVASLDAAKAALDRAELDLDYTQVKTPISGRVGKTLVKLGNLVGEGDATHLTTVVNYDPIYVNFSISERSLLQIARRDDRDPEARRVLTEIKAFMRRVVDSGFPFVGHLDYADLGVDQNTGTFMIRAVFPNPDKEILPGLFVRVRVPLGEVENAIFVPERSVAADQTGRYVMVVGKDNVVERRDVELGSEFDHMVVITQGLNGDERVVIDGIQRSRPGAVVTPSETTLPPVEDVLQVIEEAVSPSANQETTLSSPDN